MAAAFAAPIALFSAGSQVLTRLDLWALGAVGDTVPADTVGHYVAATSLAKLPNMLFFVLSSLLIPLIAKALASQQRDVIDLLPRQLHCEHPDERNPTDSSGGILAAVTAMSI